MFLHIQRILVIDDEVELKYAIVRHLRRNGFIMDSAPGDSEAKRKITASEKNGIPLDLVIRIAKTHQDDCIEFVEWVHRNYPFISVLIISGLGNMDWMIHLINPRRDATAQAPLTPEKLMDIIGDLEIKLQSQNTVFPLVAMEER